MMQTRAHFRIHILTPLILLSATLLLASGCGQRTALPAVPTATVFPPLGEGATVTPTPAATALPSTSTPLPTSTPTATIWPSTWTPVPTRTPPPTATRVVASTPTPTATPTGTTIATTAPTPSPSPTPEPKPTATSHTSGVIIYAGQLTINTYNWHDALVATEPGDAVYPYPRLDHGQVGPPAPRTYETVVLENEYTRLTLLPELGGRIYNWYDKPSGHEMFYLNPVIKPTQWGARGWWFGMGGMEWAFPVEEHGLVEWWPWSYRIQQGAGRVGVVLTTTDERTGLILDVTVGLDAGNSSIAIAPRVRNPTENEQRFQFWLNGMFALSPSNRPGQELRFTLPGDSVTVHSTGDGDVPEAGQEMAWPIHAGRDMRRYGNWNGWLGIFAWDAGYMGAYDPVSAMGVVRACPAHISRGSKIFGPANLSPGLWTDDGSGYVELWGGLTRTFWEYAQLPAHGEVGWQERWYSTNGLGGISCANEQAALHLAIEADQVRVGALTTTPRTGRLILSSGGQQLAAWQVTAAPGEPFHATHPAALDGAWQLQLLDGSGRSLLVCEGSAP